MRITDSHDERGSHSSLSAYVLVELTDIVIVDIVIVDTTRLILC